MISRRKIVGTLVPVSALTSLRVDEKDNGTFDAGIYFLDWLAENGQNGWQLLPLHETELEQGSRTRHVQSPYKSYGIGLSPQYLSTQYANKVPSKEELNDFIKLHSEWINTYGLFCALRDHFGTDDWTIWPEDIRDFKPEAILKWYLALKKQIGKYVVLQWQLHQSFDTLKRYARERKIALIGDLPYYLCKNSPLVWAYQHLFQIEKDGSLQFVSGIPNNHSTYYGRQIWGHPLYRWEEKGKVLNLWKMRLDYASKLFDIIRLDHAKAFYDFGAIHVKDINKDAIWKGPGESALKELIQFSHKNNLKLFVEDCGENIRDLRATMKSLDISGLKIFRFAINEKMQRVVTSYIEISKYPANSVVYSTTHDTEPLISYLSLLTPQLKNILAEQSQVIFSKNDKEFAKNILRALIQSPAKVVIIPIQDWFFTTERINIPGTEKEADDLNWQFKLKTPVEKLPKLFFGLGG